MRLWMAWSKGRYQIIFSASLALVAASMAAVAAEITVMENNTVTATISTNIVDGNKTEPSDIAANTTSAATSTAYSNTSTVAGSNFTLPKPPIEIDWDDPRVKQQIKIFTARQECYEAITNITEPTDGDGVYCPPVWDGVMCWPDYTSAGSKVEQLCPDYIELFNIKEYASRTCTEQGTWLEHPDPNITGHYTDFDRCHKFPLADILQKHMPIVTRISTIGYSISLVFLLLATGLMICFKKLHCQRNTIHIHLFVSFILRAIISLLRNALLVDGFALPADLEYSNDGIMSFSKDGSHWECRFLTTLWHYTLCTSYFWIFVEGLFLHNLIFLTTFAQSRSIFKVYVVVGWGLPLLVIATWLTMRVLFNNTYCWNIHDKHLFWIIEAPIILLISVNFFFFLNIVRILFTKIRQSNTNDPSRYKKFAKSTLVLIPMFGVVYIFFIILNQYRGPMVAVVHMYMEMSFNSLQGIVVSMLFCFLNGEVQAEIKKRWYRHRLRRQSVTSGRSARAMSTTASSYLMSRPSICMSSLPSPGSATGLQQSPSINSLDMSLTVASPDEVMNGQSQETELSQPSNRVQSNLHMPKAESMPHMSPSSSLARNLAGRESLPRVSSSSRVTFKEPEDSRDTHSHKPAAEPARIAEKGDVASHARANGNLVSAPAESDKVGDKEALSDKTPKFAAKTGEQLPSPKIHFRLSSLNEEDQNCMPVDDGDIRGGNDVIGHEESDFLLTNELYPFVQSGSSDESAPIIDMRRAND